jgi:hypothetical protein
MDNDVIRNKDNGGIGNKDNGGIRNKENGGFASEDNDRDVLNEYLLEQMWLEDDGGDDNSEVAGRDDDDEIRLGAGTGGGVGGGGGGGGVKESVVVSNEAGDVAVMYEAVGPPLLLDELVDANICSPAGGGGVDNDDNYPELVIRHGLLSGSDLINAPVAESTHQQYNRDNADFMIYLWDERPDLLCIPAMEMLNQAWVSVQRSCFKSTEAYDKDVVI